MSEQVMISLIGEQPIPNLLPVLYDRPRLVILVYTERTMPLSKRLKLLLEGQEMLAEMIPGSVDPYDMIKIQLALEEFISIQKLASGDLIFNLTGGTKPMAFVGYQLARKFSSPFLYLQSEGKKSVIYRYRFLDQGYKLEKVEEVPELLSIDLYLRAHLGKADNLSKCYTEGPPEDDFALVVFKTLQPLLTEVKTSVKPCSFGGLEIDLVVRRGNQVGIIEVKSGKKAREKRGVEQIIAAAEQRFLGTYTEKFLVLDREYESNNLRLAQAHGIKVIELPSFGTKGTLSEEDKHKLLAEITIGLGG
ncbi:MAG: DUF1887 family CARF protein [Bacillota bacterium]